MKTITWMTLGTLLETLSVPTAWAQGQVVEYYHLDALGTVRAVTEGSGTVLERHDYLPFGEELCPSGGTYVVCGTAPVGQSKRFTGKERDTETGLDYFGARYYGAKTGRFTTIDPVFTWQENLEDPQRWNRYAYGRNNPLKYADPDGRVLVPALLVAWGAVEIGLQIYDSYSTIQTLSDPNASFRDKAISGGGFVLGAIAPGGGYGAAGKAVAGKVDDAAKGGTYLLRKADETGDVMRTGRTNDLARRRGEHARDPRTQDLEFEVDRCTDCYAAQRGREQVIHDRYKPPLNRVNPVSPNNPRREEYVQAAEKIKDPL